MSQSLLVVSLMVKNEEVSIHSTLLSLFNGGIRHFFVLDTGSTDDTVALAQAFFSERDVEGYVQQESFIDFAASRNRTLELTEQQFPHIPFIFMPDAEWYLYNTPDLLNFCTKEQHNTSPLYLIRINMNHIEFFVSRLFRTSCKVRFVGVVHEVPNQVTTIKVPASVYIEVSTSSNGVEKSQRRWWQDLMLLSTELKKNPQDSRTAFYLGQTHECLGQFEEAYKIYLHRSTLKGWDEENFMAYYRLAGVIRRMSIYEPAEAWAKAMAFYLTAFSLRPQRIEPLLQIADYYWPNNIQTCYLFARYAYDVPYPEQDLLFVEKKMYEFGRYEIMSRCAWYMGEYTLGEQATLKALAVHPELEYLNNNLRLYQDKLAMRECMS
jgi:tetratricopeptide (TPR) repeat protein